MGRERREREKVSSRRGGRRCIVVLGAMWWSNGRGELEVGASWSWRWLNLGRFSRDILQLAGGEALCRLILGRSELRHSITSHFFFFFKESKLITLCC